MTVQSEIVDQHVISRRS